MSRSPLDGTRPGRLAGLPRRIHLTYRYHGVSGLVRHTLMFPLRLTGLDRRLGLGIGPRGASSAARRWYRDHGRPVTVVIPSYRDAPLVARLVAEIRRTTPADRVRIIVDRRRQRSRAPRGPGAHRRHRGDRRRGQWRLRGQRQPRPAGGGPRARRRPAQLRRDPAARLAGLPAARDERSTGAPGSPGAKLLYPDNRIQYAGTIRNARAPEWFDHRYRGKPADWGPADVPGPTLAATGACMYIRRDAWTRSGSSTRRTGWAMRTSTTACAPGRRDTRWPTSRRAGCITTSPPPAAPRLASASSGHSACSGSAGRRCSGRARCSPRTAGCASCTSPRARSSAAVTATSSSTSTAWPTAAMTSRCGRSRSPPNWFELRCPVRTFSRLRRARGGARAPRCDQGGDLVEHRHRGLAGQRAHGIPVYFVQDIETSYYPDAPERRYEVLNTYRPEFRFLTISGLEPRAAAASSV